MAAELLRTYHQGRKRITKEFISKTSLKACFFHAGLSGIFLQEGFPTSGNDIQVALLMTVLVNQIREYILNNPMQWELDTENPQNMKDTKLKND
jgi:hypothetical protein